MQGDLNLLSFYNQYTLNIFADASIKRIDDRKASGCYGAIAYCGDVKITEDYKIRDFDSTSNNCEIRAIRLAVRIALQYMNQFPVVNIFSDSQVSIFGIRNRIYSWVKYGNKLYGYGHIKIKHQSIFIEILDIIINNNLRCNFWHQKGHVNINKNDHIQNAIHVFQASNAIRGIIDFDFIKYISSKNNEVDNNTRNLLYEDQTNIIHKGDPFSFHATKNFNDKLKLFRQLQSF